MHHTATTSLVKLGENDLAWIAAERAMNAAGASEDPAVVAASARCVAHALLALGRYVDAVAPATSTAEGLRNALHVPAGTTLYGMLYLRRRRLDPRLRDLALRFRAVA